MPIIGPGGAAGGGSQPGVGVDYKFAFTHATPGLTAGVVVYTPTETVDILDLWISTLTAWDGTTPLGDVGTFIGGNFGLFAKGLNAVDLTTADMDPGGNAGVLWGPTQSDLQGMGAQVQFRAAPFTLNPGNPLLVVVSQTGEKSGAAAGSTVGSSLVRFRVVTAINSPG